MLSDISFKLNRGESLGLIGGSGSGKTTLSKIILRLEKETEGSLFFEGENITAFSSKRLHEMRKYIQVVFQNPKSSLNPRWKIWESIIEPLNNFSDRATQVYPNFNKEKKKIAQELLELVGLDCHQLDRYPHELSGGQLQRVCIARALSLQPKILICDEPTSSLDVSVQAHVLNLLLDLKNKMNLSLLFISHDISAVLYLCENIIVFNEGNLIDQFKKKELFSPNRNSYTKKLLESVV